MGGVPARYSDWAIVSPLAGVRAEWMPILTGSHGAGLRRAAERLRAPSFLAILRGTVELDSLDVVEVRNDRTELAEMPTKKMVNLIKSLW